MANNDILPYSKAEALITPSGAAQVSPGVTPAKQCTKMGLTIVCAVPGSAPNGNYSVIIETADTAESAGGEWLENSTDRVDGITAAGTFQVYLSEPIIDKARARIETDATNPERLTFQLYWGCDTELTLNS